MFFDNQIINAVAQGLILAVAALLWVILLVRVVGLRSFSKMTSFDFVMTVAMGSLVATASQATQWSGFIQVLAAMTGLFAIQYVLARGRKASDLVESALGNTPVLLMRDGEVIESALVDSRVSMNDLRAKLREANVLDFSQVRAAVLETTGDVSILHGDHLDDSLLENVRSA
ncbi:DUF421 domain-containing protein [Porphyrobacter algicida]|uniref:DUF421 domain-containing protein n=1 Tax=Qipengyuania algicida TaxID=1836209 RepID=A0A845AKW3_9SPHN|nr:YetF domain-containing protein [Qipengyuania algicida]MXP29521.1 DUF421 domain-containing protein [Qipengyuania algicida]